MIDPDGQQIGVLPLADAQAEAERRNLDLIELAPESEPPVCRIMDYGKFRYEQQKKLKDSTKKTKHSGLKTIRLRPNTDEHDIDFLLRRGLKFLEKGYHVKFNVIFRGPELRHKNIGREQLQKFIDGCQGKGELDAPPHMEGHQMVMILRPLSTAQ